MKSCMVYIGRDKSIDRILDRANTIFHTRTVCDVCISTFTVGCLPTLSSPSTRTIVPGENRFRFTGKDDHRLPGESHCRSSLPGIVFVVSSSSLIERGGGSCPLLLSSRTLISKQQSGYRYRFVWSKEVAVYVSRASKISCKLLKLSPLSSICKYGEISGWRL